MTQQANEMAMAVDTSMAPAPEYANSSAVVMTPNAVSDPSIAIGSPEPAPAPSMDPSSITVYANSINPISYNGEANGIACFDVVFSVGVSCGDGTCKTYQVVKRIGVDKLKMAVEAETTTPVSIVEAKKETADKVVVQEQLSQVDYFKRLAGL